MSNSDKTSDLPTYQKRDPQKSFCSFSLQILVPFAVNPRISVNVFANYRGRRKKQLLDGWVLFQNSRSFMNGCSGSGETNFPPSAINRKTSESADSPNNHKVTLCAFRRRQIVLSICPINFSGSGAVAKTSRLCASASTCPRATCSDARNALSECLEIG